MSGKISLLPYPFFYKEVRFLVKPILKRCRGQVNFMCQQLMADEAGSNDVVPWQLGLGKAEVKSPVCLEVLKAYLQFFIWIAFCRTACWKTPILLIIWLHLCHQLRRPPWFPPGFSKEVVSILTTTQRFGWRIDKLSAFELYFWSTCLEREKASRNPNPRKVDLGVMSHEAPVLLNSSGWAVGGIRVFIWNREPLTEPIWCWRKKKKKRQVVIFEKNTFLVITRAHTKEMQAGF